MSYNEKEKDCSIALFTVLNHTWSDVIRKNEFKKKKVIIFLC